MNFSLIRFATGRNLFVVNQDGDIGHREGERADDDAGVGGSGGCDEEGSGHSLRACSSSPVPSREVRCGCGGGRRARREREADTYVCGERGCREDCELFDQSFKMRACLKPSFTLSQACRTRTF